MATSRAFSKPARVAASPAVGARHPLAPVNLAVNGTFDTNTDWTFATAGVAINGGSLHFNDNATNTTAIQSATQPAGTYRFQFDVVAHTKGNLSPRINTTGGLVAGTAIPNTPSPSGTYFQDLVCPNPVTEWQVRCNRQDLAMDCRVDNVVITRIA